MFKLIKINKGHTIYFVLDSETGEIKKYSRMELMKYAFEVPVLGVDTKHALMKPVKSVDYYFDVRSWRNFVYKLKELGYEFGIEMDIEIHNLTDEEEIVFAKMIYNEVSYIKNFFFSVDNNVLNFYTSYDRLIIPNDKVSMMFTIYPFPFTIGGIKNGGKFIIEDSLSVFQYLKEQQK